MANKSRQASLIYIVFCFYNHFYICYERMFEIFVNIHAKTNITMLNGCKDYLIKTIIMNRYLRIRYNHIFLKHQMKTLRFRIQKATNKKYLF